MSCRPPLQDVDLAALPVMQMAVSSANSNSAWILQRHAHAAGDEAGTTESAAVRMGEMSASSGEKRRRRRERRFLQRHNLASIRATVVAIGATGGFLVLQLARSLLGA